MQTRRPNPYHSPSSNDSRPRGSVRWLRLSLLIGVNVLALTSVVASQIVLRRRFAIMEMDLPFQTRLAMGPLVPIVLGVLIMITAMIHISTNDRCRERWEATFIVALGFSLGFYVIACSLAFTTGPMELSLCRSLLLGLDDVHRPVTEVDMSLSMMS